MKKRSELHWFSPRKRGNKGQVAKDAASITFFCVEKKRGPRGVRLNCVLSRELISRNVNFVQIGVLNNKTLVIKPCDVSAEDRFKIIGKRYLSVSSVELSNWAKDHGINAMSFNGKWVNDRYEFLLK